MDEWLVGGRVQRVRFGRVGARDVVIVQVRHPRRTEHLVMAGGIGCGLLDAPAHDLLRQALAGATPAPQATWRARIAGALVLGVSQREARFSREGRTWQALVERGSLAVTLEAWSPSGVQEAGTDGASAALSRVDPPPDAEALRLAGGSIVEQVRAGQTTGRGIALRRGVAKAIARVQRRRNAIQADLLRALEAENRARAAEPFVGQATRAPRGATQLSAVDWSSGVAREVFFPLDPARSAHEQLEALFHRARRLRDGARIGRARLDEAERSLAALSSVAEALLSFDDAGLDALDAQARAAAPRDFALSQAMPAFRGQGEPPPADPRVHRSAAKPRASHPYRTYLSASGARILVGRGAEKNDALTFHVARPHDLWLHAKGRAGAHVIVPLAKGASCPSDVLVEAAHLAAHFSQAKHEAAVEVAYAPRRHLRKPKGSAPGLVVVDREKVLLLRRDEALLRALLERERP